MPPTTTTTTTTFESSSPSLPLVNVLMVGTGEYTTGYVGGQAADSDKGAGVVGLVMMDLRRRHKVQRLAMCGVNGTKFPGIRAHLERNVGQVYHLDTTCETFPDDSTIDPQAYKTALATFQKGDVAIIFTPDDTHYDIAMECVKQGMHVMITKPIVQTLQHHHALANAAHEQNVLIAVEVGRLGVSPPPSKGETALSLTHMHSTHLLVPQRNQHTNTKQTTSTTQSRKNNSGLCTS